MSGYVIVIWWLYKNIHTIFDSGCNFKVEDSVVCIISIRRRNIKNSLCTCLVVLETRYNKNRLVSWMVVYVYTYPQRKNKIYSSHCWGRDHCQLLCNNFDLWRTRSNISACSNISFPVFVVRSSEVLFVVEAGDVTGAKWNLAFAPLFRAGLSVGGN